MVGGLRPNWVAAGDGRLQQLRDRVAYAHSRSPYYRAVFDAAGIDSAAIRTWDDVRRIPFITKEDVIANQEAARPFGTLIACQVADLSRVYCTAGSLYFGYTQGDIDYFTEYDSRQWRVLGVRQGDLVDIASAFHWVIAGTMFDAAIRAAGGIVIPGGPGQSEQRIRTMRHLGTTVLQAFTPYAEALGREVRDAGLEPGRDLRVRLLIIGGEMRTSEAHRALSELWGGAAIRELYGVAEAGIMAADCFEVGDGMHFNENIVVELVDPDSGEPTEATKGGEIVVTELGRQAQPYIRYRTGDITEGINFKPCRCGRTTPRLSRIVGRASSILRVRGLFVQPQLIASTLADMGCGERHQIVVDRQGTTDELRIVVEHRSREAGVGPAIVQKLKSAIGLTCKVELVALGTISKDAKTVDDRRRFA